MTSYLPLAAPAPWPNANARLLGVGAGLPISPLQRLALFSASDFERFTLEWADGYLRKAIPGIDDIQLRAGAGDKGRDIIVWRDPPGVKQRRWICYQCKHYDDRLGAGLAAAEIGKLLYYVERGDYSPPERFWFVTHRGVTGPLQDMLDEPSKLQAFVRSNWDKYVADKIVKKNVPLSSSLAACLDGFDFTRFAAKQPLDLLSEHAQAPRYHLPVFGAPLIERGPPPTPPSQVSAGENTYVDQLFEVIAEQTGISVSCAEDFVHNFPFQRLFDRSRITFYCAEGLKELARDQMADVSYFTTLLHEFRDGLYFHYSALKSSGYDRLTETIKASQSLQLGGHTLAPHVLAADREGMCHHLANEKMLTWRGGSND